MSITMPEPEGIPDHNETQRPGTPSDTRQTTSFILNDVLLNVEGVLAEPLPRVVESLVASLGGPDVAVIGGVSKTSAVAEWMRGEREPKSLDREMRLRLALQLTCTLEARYGVKTVRAWFRGANHRLGDEMPIALLARAPLADIQRELLAAARAFVDR